MVYEFTLSYNPKKDICHQQGAHAIAMGFWRKERIIKNNNNNSDRNNSSSDSSGRNNTCSCYRLVGTANYRLVGTANNKNKIKFRQKQ